MAQVHASDEMYIPCALAVLGHYPEPGGERNTVGTRGPVPENVHECGGVVVRRLTYSDWSDNGKHPRHFHRLTADMIGAARAEGCLFLRKLRCRDADEHAQLEVDWSHVVLKPTLCGSSAPIELAEEERTEDWSGDKASVAEGSKSDGVSIDEGALEPPHVSNNEVEASVKLKLEVEEVLRTDVVGDVPQVSGNAVETSSPSSPISPSSPMAGKQKTESLCSPATDDLQLLPVSLS